MAATPSSRGARIAASSAATPTALTAVQRYSMVPMRRPGTKTAPSGVVGSNSIPCEVTCSEIRMSYFDGPVLSTAKVEGVYWDATGNYTAGAGPGGEMPAFYAAVGTSDWWGGLSEYNTNQIAGGSGQQIGQVTSLGETVITPSPADNGSTITDAQMQTELAAQISAGHLPFPSLDSTGNVNTLYALYFPDNKTECIVSGECNTNEFCAYHNSFSYEGMDVPYMVLPADTPGGAESEGCGVLPTLTDDYTSYVSHELVEATTDTGIGLDTGVNYAYPAAWADNSNEVGEVMDACDTGEAVSSAALPDTGFYVQAQWSNKEAACVFSKPYLNVSPVSATIPTGQSETYTAVGLNLPGSASATFAISPTGHGATCTANVCTSTLAGDFTVTATYAGDGTSDPVALDFTGTECQPGTFSPNGDSPCTSAPPGTYVAGTGATSPTACPAGAYNPLVGQTSCFTAPAGTYVAGTGASEPTDCAAGTYNPDTGSTSASACIAAPAGTYVPGPGGVSPTSCALGTFNPSTGATSCLLANPGDYVGSIGSSTETPCSAGAYSADPGQASCTLADPGSYVANPGSSGEVQCAAGSYSAAPGAIACTLADPGSFVADAGSTAEVQCAAGSFSADPGAIACTLADPGSFVADAGSTAEVQCAAGSYSAAPGAIACTLADPGSFVADAGSTAEVQCAAGAYSAAPGAIACTLADPGSYVAGPGSAVETPCAAGSFSAAPGAIACTLAAPGSYVAHTGATAAVTCAAGSFSAAPGALACTLAPAGSYVGGTGATAAIKCAAGAFSAAPGATGCTLAPAGSYVAGVGSTHATLCAAGSFSAAPGAIACTLAPAGSYVAGTGATTATQCALGAFSSSSGATSCELAPLNTYVGTVGAVGATSCPAHTFTLHTGSTSASACLHLAITTTTLPGGTVYSSGKVKYHAKLSAKGGTRPYKWSLAQGKLPKGLSLDASTGVISGKATKAGTYTFTIKVADTKTKTQSRRTAKATLTITIST